MADDLKVYTQETIKDASFPVETTTANSTDVTSGGTAKVYSPNTISDQPMPKPVRAVELMSTQLNTNTRKILAEFGFTPSGAIQIGQYQNGVSGDIRISPNGILGRDLSGETTFAIDGDTGNATFKGEVRSGSVLTGGVIIQDESGQTVIDGSGLVSTSTFPNFNQIVLNSGGNLVQTISTDATYTTIDDGSHACTYTITVARSTKIFIIGRADLDIYSASNHSTMGRLAIKVGSTIVDEAFFTADLLVTGGKGYQDGVYPTTCSYVGTLPAGTTTIYLQGRIDRLSGAANMEVFAYNFSYFLLGT